MPLFLLGALAAISLFLSACEFPREYNETFSVRHEVLVFDSQGGFLFRSPGLRGVPRDIEMLPNGHAVVAVDGRGLVEYDIANNRISNYFGPVHVNDIDVIAGKSILGLRPAYMAVAANSEQALFLDANGNQIGDWPVLRGTNDIDLLDNGNFLVVEGQENRIREITPDGAEVWRSAVSLLNPVCAVPTGRNTFLISDFDHHRVIELNRSNVILREFNGMNHPRQFDLLPDQSALVADSDLRRVAHFIQPGEPIVFAGALNRTVAVKMNPADSTILVGVEAFFPPTDDDRTGDVAWMKFLTFAIWLATSLSAVLLTGLAWHLWGRAASWRGHVFDIWQKRREAVAQYLLALACLSAVLGCWLLSLKPFGYGALFIGIALPLGWFARWPRGFWFEPCQSDEADDGMEPAPTAALHSVAMILAGVLLVWLALLWSAVWPNDWPPIAAWALGCLLCVFGFQARAKAYYSTAEALWLVAILAAALFFRVFRIDEIPYGLWLDETYAVYKALDGWERNFLAPFQTQALIRASEFEVANLYLIAIASFIKLASPSFLAIKLISILPGMGIVLAVYWLGRWSFGAWAGRFAGLLFAMNAWQTTFARWGWLQQVYVFFAIMALAFLIRAYRWKCPRSAAWCGLFLGLGMYTYVPILLTIAVAAAFFVFAWFEPARRLSIKLFFITAFLFALAFSPLWMFFEDNPGIFMARAQAVGISHQMMQDQSLEPLVHNLKKYAAMFHIQGDYNPRHNFPNDPLLDPITGGLFILGLALAARYFHRPGERMVLLAFFAAMAGAVATAPIEAPNSFRSGMAGPMVCLLAALPLASLCQAAFKRWDEGEWQGWALPMIFVLLSGAAYLNYQKYFERLPGEETWIASMGQRQHLIYMNLEPDDAGPDRLFIHPDFNSRTLQVYGFLLNSAKHANELVKFNDPSYIIWDVKAKEPDLKEDRAVFIMPTDYEPWLVEHYPGMEIQTLFNPYGESIAVMGRLETK